MFIRMFFILFVFMFASQNVFAEQVETKKPLDKNVIFKFYKHPAAKEKMFVYMRVFGRGEYPYPNTEDMINRMIGRRVAYIYAYKKLVYFVKNRMPDYLASGKIKIDENNFVDAVRIINTEFFDKYAESYVEITLVLTDEEFNIFRNKFKDEFLVEPLGELKDEYKDNPIFIDYGHFMSYIKEPDSRFVDIEKIKKLEETK